MAFAMAEPCIAVQILCAPLAFVAAEALSHSWANGRVPGQIQSMPGPTASSNQDQQQATSHRAVSIVTMPRVHCHIVHFTLTFFLLALAGFIAIAPTRANDQTQQSPRTVHLQCSRTCSLCHSPQGSAPPMSRRPTPARRRLSDFAIGSPSVCNLPNRALVRIQSARSAFCFAVFNASQESMSKMAGFALQLGKSLTTCSFSISELFRLAGNC